MERTDPPHPPSGRPLGYDRDTVLGVALDLLWAGGFEATPIGDLIDAMGLSRSSFYAAFGSKRGVMLEAIRLYSRRSIAALEEIAARDKTDRDKLRGMIRALAMLDEPRGCFMVNCISEIARRDMDVRVIAARHNAVVERLVASMMQDREGRHDMARALVSFAYGATLLKTTGTPPEEIAAMLDALISVQWNSGTNRKSRCSDIVEP